MNDTKAAQGFLVLVSPPITVLDSGRLFITPLTRAKDQVIGLFVSRFGHCCPYKSGQMPSSRLAVDRKCIQSKGNYENLEWLYTWSILLQALPIL